MKKEFYLFSMLFCFQIYFMIAQTVPNGGFELAGRAFFLMSQILVSPHICNVFYNVQ